MGDPYAHATEYPGFFVLPHRKRPAAAATHEQSAPPSRLEQFKQALIYILVLGGLVAALGYFFYAVGMHSTLPGVFPSTEEDAPRPLHGRP